jgi:hypothetical protein
LSVEDFPIESLEWVALGQLFAYCLLCKAAEGKRINFTKETERMVQPSIWGPPLWRVLHTCAERLGKQKFVLLAEDEKRVWLELLRELEFVMPCAVCKKHYKERCKKHACPFPIDSLKRYSGEAFQVAARKWLWELHESVTLSKQRDLSGAPIQSVLLSDLPDIYGAVQTPQFEADLRAFLDTLKDAILMHTVDGAQVRQFRKTMAILRKFIGI